MFTAQLIFAARFNAIGVGIQFHMAERYYDKKWNSGKCFQYYLHKRAGTFCSPLSPEEWIISLCRGFPSWPQTLCSLSQGRIPVDVHSICTVTEEQNMSNMHHICPDSSLRRQWVSTALTNSQSGFNIWVPSKPPWQMWFCTTIKSNWSLTK